MFRKFVSTLNVYFCADMEYKVGLIEKIYFAYRLYGYNNIHAWIQMYSRSFRSFRIHGACCELFNEHLSVFLDMVNIKHNIEL